MRWLVRPLRCFLPVAVFVLAAAPMVLPTALGGDRWTKQVTSEVFAVEGYLYVAPGTSPKPGARGSLERAIFVPGITTWIQNLVSGVRSPTKLTDLSGRFLFGGQVPGRYRVCWKAYGFVSGCTRPFSADVSDENVGPVPLRLARLAGRTTFYGSVRLADRSVARTFEPFASVNAYATVFASAVGAKQRLASPARVNNDGRYVLPGVRVVRKVRVAARIEKASAAATFSGASLAGLALRRLDLTFRNNPPKVEGIVAETPRGTHWSALPGETVKLTARVRDPDGDPVSVTWIEPDGAAVVGAASGNSVTYTLPNAGGVYSFTAVAGDRKGGYGLEVIPVTTHGILFAGVVSATDAPVLANAEIDINGQTTQTDPNGRFTIIVGESPRYVLNIRRPGYALLSRIYDVGLTGGHWTLTRVSVTTADPANPIDVVNTRRPTDCPGSLSDQAKRKGRPNQRDCPTGIRVKIPANALIDSAGNPPSGPVEIELSTVDLRAPDAMPGDWTSLNTVGDLRVMESYGAGTVEIRSGPTVYDLRPGTQAEVEIPIEAAQLAAGAPIPATIPLLSYDETRGLWVEEAKATRVANSYVGKVGHFSAINTDQLKVNQACVRIESTLMPSAFDLELRFTPAGGTAETVRTTAITDNGVQRFHAVYNLPLNQDLRLKAFNSGTTTAIQLLDPSAPTPGTPTATTEVTVNSGPDPQNPTSPNQPDWPYSACKRAIELTPFPGTFPGSSTGNTFLYGLFSFAAINLNEASAADRTAFEAAATAYYNAIDPPTNPPNRDTLTAFKTVNEFGSGTGFETAAQYANSGDLGFGRDMHCHKKPSGDVACYVTNYGDRFTDDVADAFQAKLDSINPTIFQEIATVAMEYSPVENQTGSGFQLGGQKIVKFYVYNAAGNRVGKANLDGVGERPVPALCMTCHGNQYQTPPSAPTAAPVFTDAQSADLGSRFILFDLRSFTLPQVPVPPSGAIVDLRTTQQQAFKDLNLQIVAATGLPAEAQRVLDGMYGPGGGSPVQNEHFFVPGWSGGPPAGTEPSEQQVYDDVVAPSCRGCHLSQAPEAISWDQASVFSARGGFIDSLACQQHKMPHAMATHNRFWFSVSPRQPLKLHDFLNGPTTAPETPSGTGTSLGYRCVRPAP